MSHGQDPRQHRAPQPVPPTIEQRVIAKISARRETGLKKYGTSMERSDLTRKQWLQHAQEEAMDTAIYLEKLIQLEGE